MPRLHLEWEVKLRGSNYMGRASTPDKALVDLHEHLAMGVAHANEELERVENRLIQLREMIEVAGGNDVRS